MLQNREGQRVPQATFRTRTENGDWKTITTDDLFKGQTVVVFSLPGRLRPLARPRTCRAITSSRRRLLQTASIASCAFRSTMPSS